jgi:hypothetical protein
MDIRSSVLNAEHILVIHARGMTSRLRAEQQRYMARTRPTLPAMPQTRCSGAERFDFHSVTEISQELDQSVLLLVLVTTIEVTTAEVLVEGPVLEHVIDGRKDGGSDGYDRLLGAAPGFDATKLGLQVAVLLFHRRPCALYERGFEPGSARAQAIGPALASALVVAQTQTSP